MLGAFHTEPIMRFSFLFIAFLMPASAGAAPAAPALTAFHPACAAAAPVLAGEPPAWLLLAAALLLLGAGRLAASRPRIPLRWRRTAPARLRHR